MTVGEDNPTHLLVEEALLSQQQSNNSLGKPLVRQCCKRSKDGKVMERVDKMKRHS